MASTKVPDKTLMRFYPKKDVRIEGFFIVYWKNISQIHKDSRTKLFRTWVQLQRPRINDPELGLITTHLPAEWLKLQLGKGSEAPEWPGASATASQAFSHVWCSDLDRRWQCCLCKQGIRFWSVSCKHGIACSIRAKNFQWESVDEEHTPSVYHSWQCSWFDHDKSTRSRKTYMIDAINAHLQLQQPSNSDLRPVKMNRPLQWDRRRMWRESAFVHCCLDRSASATNTSTKRLKFL